MRVYLDTSSLVKLYHKIQLASAVQANELGFADHFTSADNLLLSLMKLEGLSI